MDEIRAAFHEDGVVLVRRALDRTALAIAEAAFSWSLEHPGPRAKHVLAGKRGAFYQDHANPAALAAYRPLLQQTTLVPRIAGLLGSRNLWLLYEQIWLKEGCEVLPTPWHQDLPYLPLAGEDLATAWISLDPVEKANSLEFVRRSHRGPLYNPTAFDPDDPAAAMFTHGDWPALPDIQATLDAWPIVSWEIEPGDVVVFHPAILHGGAATHNGQRRRTVSLRFFGDRAYCAERPDSELKNRKDDDPITQMTRMPPGAPFRHCGFFKIL